MKHSSLLLSLQTPCCPPALTAAYVFFLPISCAGAMLSSNFDGSCRICSAQDLTYLLIKPPPSGFYPFAAGALLSSSFDGSCRIWNARDPTAPPIVLSVDPARFGPRGAAMHR